MAFFRAERIASTSAPQLGFFPFDFFPPEETHSAKAAACSGAHFCERHSSSVVASEAQARSASCWVAAEEVEEEVEEVEIDDEEEEASPPPKALELAAMQAAKARRWAPQRPRAFPRSSAETEEREEKGHIGERF